MLTLCQGCELMFTHLKKLYVIMFTIVNTDKLNFREWLQDQIKNKGWSQSEFAREADLSRSGVNMVLNGIRPPGIDFCKGTAKALNIPEENVFIIAGLLDQPKNYDPEWEEWKLMLDQLSEEENERLYAIAKTLLDMQEKEK